jgi:hypothetical protein
MKYFWYRFVDHPAAKRLAISLRDQPAEWNIDRERRYTLDHQPSGLQVWVANGWPFCALWAPEKLKLGLVGKTRVWLAARAWMRKYAPSESKREAFWRSSRNVLDLVNKRQS